MTTPTPASSAMAMKAAHNISRFERAVHCDDARKAEIIDEEFAPTLDWNRRARAAMQAMMDDSPSTPFSLEQLARDIDKGMALPGMAVVLRDYAAKLRALLAEEQGT